MHVGKKVVSQYTCACRYQYTYIVKTLMYDYAFDANNYLISKLRSIQFDGHEQNKCCGMNLGILQKLF
jgi:hypothetical protein